MTNKEVKHHKISMTAVSGLRGITYSEFDNVVGPKLRFSYPPDVLPKETFEPLSDYVIVGKHLCDKIILVKTQELQFLNYSVSIDNPKYERNTLLFSFGFVLDVDVPSEPYEPLLRKLSTVMVSLEVEKEFLFQEMAKQRIEAILCVLYKSLISNGEVFLELDEHNFLALKLFKAPISPQPRILRDFEVPTLLFSKLLMSNLPWDISLQHLFPFIDGIRHIRRIARDAEMDIDCVVQSLRTLMFYECVIVVDVFRFSNVYQACYAGAVSMLNQAQIAELEEFCGVGAISGMDSNASLGAPETGWGSTSGEAWSPPAPDSIEGLSSRGRNILRILQNLRPGKTLGEVICEKSSASGCPSPSRSAYQTFAEMGSEVSPPKSSSRERTASLCTISTAGIDLRRLIAIAQVKGYIRRLHEYPILACRPQHKETGDNGDANGTVRDNPKQSLNINIANIQGAGSGEGKGRVLKTVRGDGLGALPNLLDDVMLSALDGSLPLDAFCCMFDVPPAAVLQHPSVFIVYK